MMNDSLHPLIECELLSHIDSVSLSYALRKKLDRAAPPHNRHSSATSFTFCETLPLLSEPPDEQEQDKEQRQKRYYDALLLSRDSEILSPHSECQSRKSTILIATVNLIATICGGGVLSLPLAFRRAGILPTTALMLYAGLTTDFSLYLLVACARRTGGRTYGDVAQAAFGSCAQIVTTVTLSIMLFGTLVAYSVLVRDIWGGVIFGILGHPLIAANRTAANFLLGGILLMALPLMLKKDLHALRHTCYVGFSSCLLLTVAVIYRAGEKLSNPDPPYEPVKWYSTDPADLIFAFPIVALSFFCSYNVLSVHAQLSNPTRKRLRTVLDASTSVCFVLFYAIGLCGYLYAGSATEDNIFLNFPISDPAIMAGRTGYCFTLMFGLPLIVLPCRDAVLGIPEQIAAWRRDTNLVQKFNQIASKRQAGAHLVINGVDFDGPEPVWVCQDPEQQHGVVLKDGGSAALSNDETEVTTPSSSVDMSSSTSTIIEELFPPWQNEEDDQDQHAASDSKEPLSQWKDTLIHVGSTLVILSMAFTVAIIVPGVAAVWSIFGSSMAIWIAFIVPTACYLKIREHKGLTIRAVSAWFLLFASCVSAVVCTRYAVVSAFAQQ